MFIERSTHCRRPLSVRTITDPSLSFLVRRGMWTKTLTTQRKSMYSNENRTRTDSGVGIQVPQSKYLNLIEQHHRAIKRVVRPMLGFKSIQGAHAIIAGIKTMHMIKKMQLDFVRDRTSYAADTFYFRTS